MARFRITVSADSRESMLSLVRDHAIVVFDHGLRRGRAAEFIVDGLAELPDVERLEAEGFRVEIHEDVDVLGRERQAEVGRGNRYLDPNPDRN